ncbi:hypothetical protein B0A58_06605 [Flavobacterium branchiophilum NBRC 15030 = ATCC 35035]|uniref:Probable membrane transporter protein n=1 Tax=Flavobacterium branchiophilum TaxID=55197 RepID=A0A543G809_9FLAO|nr:TSUP family transporter [Flavobacterium branchiophilum]OXA76924.1 hypothetical protein B0A58_06605 [Flavobacterium branchiophilum NBRC 15030 = ATCC 35035]TQM42217.1 hypothetical protein BC670_3256 [Flavobacterium branchiophilum]GEM54331.1 UPF0721 transmembrane protein [Flavobacterium branchiophilum NBRC 15030 = ATCC 35035]
MDAIVLFILCCTAFVAGFIDAIVGGGGLLQTPMSLVLLPQFPVATVIGSVKIPSFSGTFLAAIQYLKKVKLKWNLLIIMILLAIPAAFLGSLLLTKVNNNFMKPILLIILVGLLIYTYTKKNFGQKSILNLTKKQQIKGAIVSSVVIGFYDGFIGPGTGSFFVLAFISLLGYDFLEASANAKMVNLATNLGSIILFSCKGKIIWSIALPMAISNAFGGFLGSKLAIQKGNAFIRIFFIIVVVGTLLRFGYDVFYH